jgi:hypothetical protein
MCTDLFRRTSQIVQAAALDAVASRLSGAMPITRLAKSLLGSITAQRLNLATQVTQPMQFRLLKFRHQNPPLPPRVVSDALIVLEGSGQSGAALPRTFPADSDYLADG